MAGVPGMKRKKMLTQTEYWELRDEIVALDAFFVELTRRVHALERAVDSGNPLTSTVDPEPAVGSLVKLVDFSDRVEPTFYVRSNTGSTAEWHCIAGLEDDRPRTWEWITTGSYEVIYEP